MKNLEKILFMLPSSSSFLADNFEKSIEYMFKYRLSSAIRIFYAHHSNNKYDEDDADY